MAVFIYRVNKVTLQLDKNQLHKTFCTHFYNSDSLVKIIIPFVRKAYTRTFFIERQSSGCCRQKLGSTGFGQCVA